MFMAKVNCPKCNCKMIYNPMKQSTSYCVNCGYNVQKLKVNSWHPPAHIPTLACSFPTT